MSDWLSAQKAGSAINAETVVKILCLIEIKTVAEQKELFLRVNAVFPVVCYDLLAPLIGIAAVVADIGIVVHPGVVEIKQEILFSRCRMPDRRLILFRSL